LTPVVTIQKIQTDPPPSFDLYCHDSENSNWPTTVISILPAPTLRSRQWVRLNFYFYCHD